MTNKLVVIKNSLKVPKIKKILLYEMKILVPNYSYLQNPRLGCYRPQIPVLSVLCPQLNLLNPHEQNSWVRHWALSLDFFTLLHKVLTSIVSSPLSSDGSFIIVPIKVSNVWLFDEDMVENESSILNQIQHKPQSFTSCTLWQIAAQEKGNRLGQVLLQGHTTCTR